MAVVGKKRTPGIVKRPIPAQAGIGLRPRHHPQVLAENPTVPWFEVHAENFMTRGPLAVDLQHIAARYPLSLHGVGLSLGSAEAPDPWHLKRLVALNEDYSPGLISDHLSWSATDALVLPDLFPLPYSEEALATSIRNVDRAQNSLRRTILVENPSRYFPLSSSTMSEGEFLQQLVARTACGVLLDVNNVYVSAVNCGSDPRSALDNFLLRIAPQYIGEIHLAGHTAILDDEGNLVRIDDHGSPVKDEVWGLFDRAVRHIGPVPTLIEWDTRIPSFNQLRTEAARAQSVLDWYASLGVQHAPAC